MKEDDRFVRQDDVLLRLLGGICFYKGEPYYVNDIQGFQVYLAKLPTVPGDYVKRDDMFKVNANNKNLDVTSPDLGYMNLWGGGCFYITRIPKRQMHMIITCKLVGTMGPLGGWQHLTQGQFLSPGFKDMLMKEYPKFNKSLKQALENPKIFLGCAFHLDFALTPGDKPGSLSLAMHGKTIAEYTNMWERFTLLEEFDNSFMRNRLTQLNVPLV